MKKRLLHALTSFTIFSVLILAVSIYFIYDQVLIGPAFIGMGIIGMIILQFYKIEISSVYPDIAFGAIDNGFLILFAIVGGTYAGVAGAIIGGAAGNTITDGLAGLFEGHIAERLRKKNVKEHRTALSSMIGTMIGCLFGAGAGLILVWLISLI